jgi:uncharacterized protein YjaG (DUF416 family)
MDASSFSDFLSGLKKQLGRLAHPHQLAFASSCCERAYPNYKRFSASTGWGDSEAFRWALDLVWNLIVNRPFEEGARVDLLKRCEASTPDTDNFSPQTAAEAALITAGQEAAFMVTLLLQFCREPDPLYGVRIATFARDTVDMYVQIVEHLQPTDPNLEEKISQHPLMVQELKNQEEDLLSLTQVRMSNDLAEFRNRAANPKRSNIGLTAQS